jgi:primosomal protein N' (replication factor Y)
VNDVARPSEGVTPQRLRVAVETPQHSALAAPLDYLAGAGAEPGSLVRVPLGRRVVTGIVWDADPAGVQSLLDDAAIKPVAEVFAGLPPLNRAWRRLVEFAAGYYQRGLGELGLAVLPPEMRNVDAAGMQRRVKRLHKTLAAPPAGSMASQTALAGEADADTSTGGATEPGTPGPAATQPLPELNPEQAAAVAALAQARGGVTLLHGVTGSGKTEIYLREAQRVLEAGGQALVLVPEINLTPQLEARFAARFPHRRIVALHSALTPAQRLQHWLAAHLGAADLVLGTRMAIFASMPRLALIVVDEEHDPSYKQQEGASYSARDLAVYRGRLEGVPVILGSATPSLETWFNALPAAGDAGAGRYTRLTLKSRIGDGVLPAVRIVDLERVAGQQGKAAVHEQPVSPPVLAALRDRLERGDQSLVLLNRRGYAPVLHCGECSWKSGCPHCSAWRVFHKQDRTLRCHHCGFTERVPRACPECGNLDIQPLGRGTEKLEEQLAELLPGARIGRIDADTTRLKGSLEHQRACRRGGRAGGHADRCQGPRLPPHHPGGRAEHRQRALLQRLPRRRAAVRAADAGRRPGRPRCGAGRAQRDVAADLAPAPPAVRCAACARLRGLCRQPAGRAALGRAAAVFAPGAAARRGAHAGGGAGLPAGRGGAGGAAVAGQRARLPPRAHRGAARGQRGARADAGRVVQPPGAAALPGRLAAAAARAAPHAQGAALGGGRGPVGDLKGPQARSAVPRPGADPAGSPTRSACHDSVSWW